jgi:hypothetical protein
MNKQYFRTFFHQYWQERSGSLYKGVENSIELALFNTIWMTAWRSEIRGDDIIPVIFDMKQMDDHPEQYDWLIPREELVIE